MEKEIRRSEALWNNTIIRIESIFDVIDGMQINKPKELKELREKSRRGELYCACGRCGANLILVAGDKNLRKQHFRVKSSAESPECEYVTEGVLSIWSKMVLEDWLRIKTGADDIERAVPISDVDDTERKYEFTYLTRGRKLALDYCRKRENLSEEKLELLDSNANGIRIVHIVDGANGGTEGQYPEGLMKIQNRQGYCLLLYVSNSDYHDAVMKATFYDKNERGSWTERVFAEGPLDSFDFDLNRDLWFKKETSLVELLDRAKAEYRKSVEERIKKREAEEARLAQIEIEYRKEEERRRKEEAKQREEEERLRQKAEEDRIRQESEAERLYSEKEKIKQEENERLKEERRKSEELFMLGLDKALSQQERAVYDSQGRRWVKCVACGKYGVDQEFGIYSGKNKINLGICKECEMTMSREEKSKLWKSY